MKKLSKLLALLMCFVMLFTVPVYADEAETLNDFPILISANPFAPITGTVVEVQKYGNLTMDLLPADLTNAGFAVGDFLTVKAGGEELQIPLCTNYSDVDTGSLVVRMTDTQVVVAINMGNFAGTYGIAEGDTVSFALKEKEGYMAEFLAHQLSRTNERSDYATDSVFANFRGITTTGIKPGVLYRGASPINNEIGRAAYADALIDAVNIKTIVNLADNAAAIESYRGADDFNSPYYAKLYDAGKVITLNMGVDLSSKDFSDKLVEGLNFMAKGKAPYYFHCTEGKDRAGFTAAVIEALMGASLDEIIADYMLTYENYYGVEKGSEQYEAIAKSNIYASVATIICGKDKNDDISDINLQKAVTSYLKGIGMTSKQIKKLKKALSVDSKFGKKAISGTVTELEKYGHCSSDILISDFEALGYKFGDMCTVVFDNGFTLECPFLDGYYVDNGYPLVRAYPGHTNIAVCINYGKLFEIADVEIGDSFTIFLSESKGYIDEYEIRTLSRTNERADYASDEIFANFRPVTSGTIADGVLFRSSSPINNELGRAAYADDLAEAAGIATFVNLADSADDMAAHIAAEDFDSPYYKSVYDAGNVIVLNMGVSYATDEFRADITEGAKFMAGKEAPYLFHCNEGKDRAGFMAALLEALMGATKDEIVADYMTSYANYYGVEANTRKYEVISKDILSMLAVIAGTEEITDTTDLAAGAKAYLLAGGMSEEEIAALVSKLSTPIAPATRTYVVVKNDTLRKIAKKELGAASRFTEIVELNKGLIKNPDLIRIGWELIIPAK